MKFVSQEIGVALPSMSALRESDEMILELSVWINTELMLQVPAD